MKHLLPPVQKPAWGAIVAMGVSLLFTLLLLWLAIKPVTVMAVERSCQSAVNTLAVDAFAKNRIFGQWAQQHLGTIYRDDLDYQTDHQRPGNNLADGRIGRLTDKWLSHFCREFAVPTETDNARFAAALLDSLTLIAELSQTYPDFRQTLKSRDFIQWYQQQNELPFECSEPPGCYGQATRVHRLLDHYYLSLQSVAPPPTVVTVLPSYYQITEFDLTVLGAKNEILAGLDALVDQQFSTELELNNQLRPLLKALTSDYQTELVGLVYSTPGEGDAGAVYSLSGSALKRMNQRLVQTIVSEAQLAVLLDLQDKIFDNQYLLEVALKLAAFPGMTEALHKVIVATAKKPGFPRVDSMAPLVWQATEDCGCAVNLTAEQGIARYFYGFYPYWHSASQEQTIDFSQLSRLAYFSATMVADSYGKQQLKLPQNWQPQPPFSDFIGLAQKHKVKVDLVVSSEQGRLSQNLVEQIVAAVQTPLEDDLLNELKPLLSFGTSPARTMADGVTLNLGLDKMNDSAEQDDFKAWVKRLKQQLSWPAGAADDIKAELDDPYYLNMVVPVKQLLAGEGFYRIENLLDIADSVNLFIMAFEPLNDDEQGDVELLQQIKALRQFLANKQNLAFAKDLFKKSVPMLNMRIDQDHPELFNEQLSYIDWSYLGLAMWTLPLSEPAQQAITASYFTREPGMLQPLFDTATDLCSVLCPNRWALRGVLFVLFIMSVIGVLASIRFYQLRVFFNSLAFMLFAIGVAVFLMLVLACDPYWKEYQQLIFFGFVVLIAAVSVIWRVNKAREQEFP